MIPRRSLRFGLLWRLTLTAGLPLLLLGLAAAWEALNHSQEAGRAWLEETSIDGSLAISDQLRLIETVLQSGGSMVFGGNADASKRNQRLDRLIESSPLFETVYWVDAEARLRHIGLPEDKRTRREDFLGLDLSRLSIVRDSLATGQPAWSDAHLSLITGTEALTYTLPLAKGLLIANVRIPNLALRQSTFGYQKGFQRFVLDRNGVVLLGKDGLRSKSLLNLSHLPLVAEGQKGKPSLDDFTWEGKVYQGCTAVVERTGWIVLSFAEKQHLFESHSTLFKFILASSGFGALLGLALALTFSRTLTRQLGDLSHGAKAIASGDFKAGIPNQAYLELDSLASTLRALASAVREREERLRGLAKSIAGSFGPDSLEAVVEEAGKLVSAELVLVSRLEAGTHLLVAASSHQERFEVGSSQRLADSPCAETLRQGFVHLDSGLAQQFPRSPYAKAGFDSYSGVPLLDPAGKAIGILCCLGSSPRALPPLAQEVLQLLAYRSATELLRRDAENRQQKIETDLFHAQKMEAVGRLAGGVAHDFNNILQGILGLTDLVRERFKPGDPTLEDLHLMRTTTLRGADLVKQLLVFSRREKPETRRIELNEMIGNSLRIIGRVLGEHVVISFQRSTVPLFVLADPTQIEQVLMNLSANARDAMPKGGSLRFSLQLEQGGEGSAARALLCVADSGTGIPPEIQARIFEPFFTTKEAGKGTGLGLATVYAIVTGAGGSIQVESQPEHGTTFFLRLPLYTPQVSERSEVGKLDLMETVANRQGSILIAEDDQTVRHLMEILLKGRGYTVFSAADGLAAWELFERQTPQLTLAILDVIMPKMNGRELAEKIWERSPNLPVLFCSGYFTDALDPKNLPPEQSRLLRKPFSTGDLLKCVNELLDQRR